ncbi:hypothetical protein RRF57_008993 [Xylaria bambusicola]|uniref:Uncharacterized protein n=1 Tax=Xylaria bambusicola TaxID=326684 RepID=A0AAN7USZ1_9PEZI
MTSPRVRDNIAWLKDTRLQHKPRPANRQVSSYTDRAIAILRHRQFVKPTAHFRGPALYDPTASDTEPLVQQ